ncbi:MAG: hypothetical protein ONB48_09315 [candidate division KSB1 bacterium]|nr:hypothetical protein [candidate division KSB1 bacterium]MDZ7273686.1 hypothetical protein [candidate division KSB1 bacterium]MDZ7285842.1 hypothetical protein [candidate division KSB1 bacterium]MDZ7298874.1 hypothetical protein [candidate division KSB1 bacterium]MDZ7307080.1 hypothetical protein [candidate division KSB1 bacterium]
MKWAHRHVMHCPPFSLFEPEHGPAFLRVQYRAFLPESKSALRKDVAEKNLPRKRNAHEKNIPWASFSCEKKTSLRQTDDFLFRWVWCEAGGQVKPGQPPAASAGDMTRMQGFQ